MMIDDLVVKMIEDFFKKYGIKYSKYEKKRNWVQRYFNFRLKYIGLSKRTLKISRELLSKLATCPSRDAFYEILYNAGEGKDLNPYQSKGAFNSDVHDCLFNDWGIHHLHLSNTKKKPTDFFYDRSDYLVFVRFTDDTVYFLDIQRHKENDVWSKRDFLRIIQRNWPESIADKVVPGVQWDPDLNDNEIGTLRKKGYLFGVNIDEKAYLLLGHGQMSSGDNFMATTMADNLSRWIEANKHLCDTDIEGFKSRLKEKLYLDD
jgi:hypothetical protein